MRRARSGFAFRVPQALARYVARKGSVALDGVSLTVNAVEQRRVRGQPGAAHAGGHDARRVAVGDRVNLEIDLIARYAERLLAAQ